MTIVKNFIVEENLTIIDILQLLCAISINLIMQAIARLIWILDYYKVQTSLIDPAASFASQPNPTSRLHILSQMALSFTFTKFVA